MEPLDALRHPLLITDEHGQVRRLNPAAQRLTGWTSHNAQGLDLDVVLPCRDPASGEPQPLALCCDAAIQEDGSPTAGRIVSRPDGSECYVTASVDCMRDPDGRCRGHLVLLQDATDLRELAFHAAHDTLTGLVNRREFQRRLQRLVDSARAGGRQHAVCFLDLDRFKAVNDLAGHRVGDALLQQLARRLSTILRSTDVIGRHGGDEFVVALADCPPANAWQIACALRAAVDRFRFRWAGRTLEVGVSIGIAPVTASTRSVAEVLRRADAACYRAKRTGRDRIVIAGSKGPGHGCE